MRGSKLTGSFVALITPFNKDGSVDFAAFRTLLAFQEEQGTAAVLLMGSTGGNLDALPRGEKAHHHRVLQDEDRAHADLLRCNRQKYRKHDRQRALRQGQRRRRRHPRGASLCLRPRSRHRALLSRRGRCNGSAAWHLQQPAAGQERSHLGAPLTDLQAPELRRAQGIHRARGPGCAGACRQARCVGDVLRQPESGPRRSDHEPRRAWHCQHDRQHRPGRARDHLDPVDELPRGRGFQEYISAHAPAPAFHLFCNQPGCGQIADEGAWVAGRRSAQAVDRSRRRRARQGHSHLPGVGLDKRYGYKVSPISAVAA